ncbi:hypothetical protein EVAR_54637_1 [Eumeta japonica]|uniref:Uncharacterized protein n=1 Tax=Eumeta variegata TaxID=151549 RepID=A0A4C1X8I4_EUMVA|nr:hypothetical protein EVAR_54637_1 [Eumeta japonica]
MQRRVQGRVCECSELGATRGSRPPRRSAACRCGHQIQFFFLLLRAGVILIYRRRIRARPVVSPSASAVGPELARGASVRRASERQRHERTGRALCVANQGLDVGMQVEEQWRRRWAGAAEYGKVSAASGPRQAVWGTHTRLSKYVKSFK